jgi:GNAT superfamily N-acetyltransferase
VPDEHIGVKPERPIANPITVRAMRPTDPAIRLLTTDDLDAAFKLSADAGWNQRLADWRMLLQIAPAGSFAAVAGAEIVGTAIGIDYGAFGWIAMMLVDPAWRGRGVGARLLEAAMDAVPGGTPIRLDATPLGRPLYRRYGFEDEEALTRHVAEPLDMARGRPSDRRVDAAPASRQTRRLTSTDLPAVVALDDRVFGGRRRLILEWALDNAPHYAHAIDTSAGAQYCFGRAGRLFDQIGPIVSADDEAARALVSAALGAADAKAVVVDAFDRHADFTAWLRSQGFTASRPLFRMRRQPRTTAAGEHRRTEPGLGPPSTFAERAILGPEFG